MNDHIIFSTASFNKKTKGLCWFTRNQLDTINNNSAIFQASMYLNYWTQLFMFILRPCLTAVNWCKRCSCTSSVSQNRDKHGEDVLRPAPQNRDGHGEDVQRPAACSRQQTDVNSQSTQFNSQLWHHQSRDIVAPTRASLGFARHLAGMVLNHIKQDHFASCMAAARRQLRYLYHVLSSTRFSAWSAIVHLIDGGPDDTQITCTIIMTIWRQLPSDSRCWRQPLDVLQLAKARHRQHWGAVSRITLQSFPARLSSSRSTNQLRLKCHQWPCVFS